MQVVNVVHGLNGQTRRFPTATVQDLVDLGVLVHVETSIGRAGGAFDGALVSVRRTFVPTSESVGRNYLLLPYSLNGPRNSQEADLLARVTPR